MAKPIKMLAAAQWIAFHRPDLAMGPVFNYHDDRGHWREVANIVRDEGFFSLSTGTIDVPVSTILQTARSLLGMMSET